MAFRPDHGHRALRHGRLSVPGATYFLTCCTRERDGLTCPAIFEVAVSILCAAAMDALWTSRVMTIMPDHLHCVITLGDATELPQVIRLLKGRLSPVLRAQGLHWQPAVYEHRLRPAEPLLPVFHYIFMNPYRRRLLAATQPWPYFWCSDADRDWYDPGQVGDIPYPAWLEPEEASPRKAAPTTEGIL